MANSNSSSALGRTSPAISTSTMPQVTTVTATTTAVGQLGTVTVQQQAPRQAGVLDGIGRWLQTTAATLLAPVRQPLPVVRTVVQPAAQPMPREPDGLAVEYSNTGEIVTAWPDAGVDHAQVALLSLEYLKAIAERGHALPMETLLAWTRCVQRYTPRGKLDGAGLRRSLVTLAARASADASRQAQPAKERESATLEVIALLDAFKSGTGDEAKALSECRTQLKLDLACSNVASAKHQALLLTQLLCEEPHGLDAVDAQVRLLDAVLRVPSRGVRAGLVQHFLNRFFSDAPNARETGRAILLSAPDEEPFTSSPARMTSPCPPLWIAILARFVARAPDNPASVAVMLTLMPRLHLASVDYQALFTALDGLDRSSGKEGRTCTALYGNLVDCAKARPLTSDSFSLHYATTDGPAIAACIASLAIGSGCELDVAKSMVEALHQAGTLPRSTMRFGGFLAFVLLARHAAASGNLKLADECREYADECVAQDPLGLFSALEDTVRAMQLEELESLDEAIAAARGAGKN